MLYPALYRCQQAGSNNKVGEDLHKDGISNAKEYCLLPYRETETMM